MDKEGEIPQFLINELEEPNEIFIEFNKILSDNTLDLIPVKNNITFGQEEIKKWKQAKELKNSKKLF